MAKPEHSSSAQLIPKNCWAQRREGTARSSSSIAPTFLRKAGLEKQTSRALVTFLGSLSKSIFRLTFSCCSGYSGENTNLNNYYPLVTKSSGFLLGEHNSWVRELLIGSGWDTGYLQQNLPFCLFVVDKGSQSEPLTAWSLAEQHQEKQFPSFLALQDSTLRILGDYI